ncbi:MAG: hypothetical protein IJR00_04800 [Lachnospiraceae bacterium]|nr:hypothetical protein [Lachnospiraceae bacterium]
MIWHIMHDEQQIATVSAQGRASILLPQMMPYALYLEEGEDLDRLVNNLSNFYHWCATRLLLPERVFAKEILNSLGASQSATDRDRAEIALSFHCLTLTDVWWVKSQEETLTFEEINLYDHAPAAAVTDIALFGRQRSVENHRDLANDISTNGLCPKAWVRKEDAYYLLKDGEAQSVENELLASRICSCFDVNQLHYEEDFFEDIKVSVSKLMTDRTQGIVSREAFEIYARNQNLDPLQEILELDAHGFYMMNILDYLTGNTDRHWGNWGLLIRHTDNRPLRLHDLMDFNRSFRSYDNMEGANCETCFPRRMTQKEAALEAVKNNGLHQIADIDPAWFRGRGEEEKMFMKRLQLLREADPSHESGTEVFP